MSLFRDRHHAGQRLAAELAGRDLSGDVLILGLARGGVPVAYEVARLLEMPLDVFVVRKLGVPFQPELAFGAIATGGVRVLNERIVRAARIREETIHHVAAMEREELQRRENYYRGETSPPDLSQKTVVLVDDGIATGASMSVAIEAARRQDPARIVGAAPVASRSSCDALARKVDELVCLETPDPFMGVGAWYDNFGETTNDDVRDLLTDYSG